MFYVFNKSKIYSYLIALCTVVILFVAATTLNDMVSPSKNMVETGTNVVVSNNLNGIEEDNIENSKNDEMSNQSKNEMKALIENGVNTLKSNLNDN